MGSFWSETQDSEMEPNSSSSSSGSTVIHSQSLGFYPKKLNSPIVTILKEILKVKIKLDENLIRDNNAILTEFYASFTKEMKEKDELFKLLYQQPYFTGSFYSQLRIGKPDEYDINLVLKLPFKSADLDVVFQPQAPSYVKYRLNKPAPSDHAKLINHLFDKDGYFIPEKVRCWIQSVVDRARMTYKPPSSCKAIVPSSSGPARTIVLKKKDGGVIDIDLVPAVQVALNDQKPPGINGRVYEKVKNDLECFLVPKPYQTTKQAPVNNTERTRLWRTHYPKAEKQFIHDIGCVKPIIKLLKLLRDKENWKILASYYLKTVLMWMVLENSNKDYWREDKMGERLIEALEKLAGYVKNKHLPYFFSSRCNLISKINDSQAVNINGRLCAIIKDIKKDPDNLWEIFNVPPTFNL